MEKEIFYNIINNEALENVYIISDTYFDDTYTYKVRERIWSPWEVILSAGKKLKGENKVLFHLGDFYDSQSSNKRKIIDSYQLFIFMMKKLGFSKIYFIKGDHDEIFFNYCSKEEPVNDINVTFCNEATIVIKSFNKSLNNMKILLSHKPKIFYPFDYETDSVSFENSGNVLNIYGYLCDLCEPIKSICPSYLINIEQILQSEDIYYDSNTNFFFSLNDIINVKKNQINGFIERNLIPIEKNA